MNVTPDPGRPPVILLIEDNPDDIRLLHEAFRRAVSACDLEPISTGESAVALLEQTGTIGGNRPDLALLDVNLPRMNGFEVLHRLRTNPHLDLMPVLMLSSSDAPEDVENAYRSRRELLPRQAYRLRGPGCARPGSRGVLARSGRPAVPPALALTSSRTDCE